MSTPPSAVYQPSDLSDVVMNGKNTKNALITNPQTNGVSFGRIPPNNSGVSEGEIYLKLGLIGHGRERKGAFGVRHVWEKHQKDLGIIKPEDTPRVIAEILSEGVDILLSGNTGSRPIAAFFKIVVAQSCFKQPLSAPARVSRAAPDLASRHR
jgi:hypothetical protein